MTESRAECEGPPPFITAQAHLSMAKTLYLIDGHYQIYRAYFGLPQRLTSPTGEPTGATHVFCMMLAGLIRGRCPAGRMRDDRARRHHRSHRQVRGAEGDACGSQRAGPQAQVG